MAELEAGTDRVTAVGYTYRRVAAVGAVRNRIAAGELGEISVVDGRYWCDYSCDPNAPLTWRYLGEPGSGALADVGVHLLDMLEHVLDSRIVGVGGGRLTRAIPTRPLPVGDVVGHEIGAVSDEHGKVTNEDSAAFVARFASGVAATVSVSRTAFGMPNGMSFDIHGNRGHAAFDWHRPAEYTFNAPSSDAPPDRDRSSSAPATPTSRAATPCRPPPTAPATRSRSPTRRAPS